MPIENASKVRLSYTGSLEDGTIFDSSSNYERPLEIVVGQGLFIPGFEAALLGHNVGDKFSITLEADMAFGEIDPEKFFSVDRLALPDDIPLKIGTQLQLSNENTIMDVSIFEVTEDEVVLDANHPLAGKRLTFEIEILGID